MHRDEDQRQSLKDATSASAFVLNVPADRILPS